MFGGQLKKWPIVPCLNPFLCDGIPGDETVKRKKKDIRMNLVLICF